MVQLTEEKYGKINEVQSTNKLNAKAIIAVLVISAFVATFNETTTSIMVPVTAFLIQSFKIRNLVFSALTLLLLGTVCVVFSKSFIV